MPYTMGLDFGTDSVRCVIVDCATGIAASQAVETYQRWAKGMYCDPAKQQYRQHPLDLLEAMTAACKTALKMVEGRLVKGIGIDTTGSSPVAVDGSGTPLSLLPMFSDNPGAMIWLWKDHSSITQAELINQRVDKKYLQYVGGIYSSEWFWAKWLQLSEQYPTVRILADSFVECCDWIPFLLTGGKDVKKMKRSVCAAGHKALWSEDWGGLPSDYHLRGIEYDKVFTSDKVAGHLSDEWASRLGLGTDVVVAVGAFDAHMGAVGGEIEPNYLSRVMGTSTCDILVTPNVNTTVKGICGQVPGSVIPGMIGLEAGQSAFGDAYAWVSRMVGKSIPELSLEVQNIKITENTALCIDWLNGRRTPDADQSLMGSFQNLSLATTPAELFYAVAEATCFGARAIVERFISEGVEVKGLIGLGGVAKRNPFIMQLLSDITRMPLKVHKSEQTCALGAAMFASVASKIYPNIETAMKKMGQGFDAEYFPKENLLLEKRYKAYQSFAKYIEHK
jgi:L-ribulokinase